MCYHPPGPLKVGPPIHQPAFYVALTRTRGRVYLLGSSTFTSGFIQELLEPDYEPYVELLGETSERYRCPRCHGRTIRRKIGDYGTFWGCSNWRRAGPSCGYTRDRRGAAS